MLPHLLASADVDAVNQEDMMAQETPNLFAVNGAALHVTYASTGLGGEPHFTYQDAQRTLTFDGANIEASDTEAGTIVSVPIQKT